jgi:hypothetical protein
MPSPYKEQVRRCVQGVQCLGDVQLKKSSRNPSSGHNQTKASSIGALAFIIFCGMGSAAIAGPSCTDAPKEQWIQADVMRAKIVAENYKVDVFKVTKGRCYEIYGRDKSGARVEVYFDPVTGEVVKTSVLR